MDPERRTFLVERRQRRRREIDRDSQLYGLRELKAALDAAGEQFEILYRGETPRWTPEWVPAGYSRVAWELVPPVEEIRFDDEASRREAFVAALSRWAEPAETLLLVFEGKAASFRMARAVAERFADRILDTGIGSLSPLWVTSPPRQWLLEVSFDTVRVGNERSAPDP